MNIVIIQGHPDRDERRFGRQLAQAYAEGAVTEGHEVTVIDIARLRFPLLQSKADWEGDPPPVIRAAQQQIAAARHVVLFYPLWLGAMPALLKGFLEQALRPGFALSKPGAKGLPKKLLQGRSARIVVTMGMPAAFYRYFFGAHSLKNLKRNILGFCGFCPIRESLVGLVEGGNGRARAGWLGRMRALGARAV